MPRLSVAIVIGSGDSSSRAAGTAAVCVAACAPPTTSSVGTRSSECSTSSHAPARSGACESRRTGRTTESLPSVARNRASAASAAAGSRHAGASRSPCSAAEGVESEIRTSTDLCDLPVLVLTAAGQGRAREAAVRAGASRFLTKPFANADVLALVRELAPP